MLFLGMYIFIQHYNKKGWIPMFLMGPIPINELQIHLIMVHLHLQIHLIMVHPLPGLVISSLFS